MKIVQLFKIYFPDNGGGIAAVMRNVSKILQNQEQEIVVCHGSPGTKTVIEKRRCVVIRRCRQIFSLASTPFSLSFCIQSYQAAKKANLLIYHFPYPLVDFVLLFCKRKFIVWWHCDIDRAKGLIFVYLPLLKRSLRCAERIAVPSERIIECSDYLHAYKDKCVVVPFGMPDVYFTRADRYLQKPHTEDKTCRILSIGRLVWYKGCDILLRALAELEKENFRYEMVFVGDGPLYGELQYLSKRLELSSVKFAGKITEKEKMKYLEECDFFVLPSTSKAESFGIVQLEAMAFGKPVINTTIPSAVPCVSVNGVTGISVEPGNVGQLADAIKKLGEDSDLRKRYGGAAAKKVREEYSEERMRKAFRNLLAQLKLE